MKCDYRSAARHNIRRGIIFARTPFAPPLLAKIIRSCQLCEGEPAEIDFLIFFFKAVR